MAIEEDDINVQIVEETIHVEVTTGVAGPKGDKGDKGDQGDPGNDSTVPGPQGIDGNDGSNGSNGIDGSVWFSGTGVPNDTNGVNGDYYLNTLTADVYLKAAGTWGSILLNIKGATGNKGDTGDVGSINDYSENSDPQDNDITLIEDASESYTKKKLTLVNLKTYIGSTGSSDPTDASAVIACQVLGG